MERLRQQGGAIVVEEPGVVGDNSPLSNPMDEIQVTRERELNLATRSILVGRANRLAEALDRLRRGRYGCCEECGEPIAPARLKAMPEVTTCIRCQDRIERELRRADEVEALFGAEGEEE
jgi:RNA polymerase-binding transcription factor DksA